MPVSYIAPRIATAGGQAVVTGVPNQLESLKARTLEERIGAALGNAEAVKWTLLAFEHVKAHTVGARGYKPASARNREEAVRDFIEFTQHAPWMWTNNDVDSYFKSLFDRGLSLSTRRVKQTHLRVFCNFVIADRSLANGVEKAFGKSIRQIITPLNSILHKNTKETRGTRAALNYQEVDRVFQSLDEAIAIAARGHCRSQHTLLRDKAINALMYGTGLREESISRLCLHSFSPNPSRDEFGNFGVVNVLGKGNKLNTVTLIDPAIAQMVEYYIEHVRARFLRQGVSPTDQWGDALFLGERGSRVGKKTIYRAALRAGELAGLTKRLHPHIWRHTYATHSRPLQGVENTQRQMAHTFQSTTDGYYHIDVEKTASLMNDAIQHTVNSAIMSGDRKSD